jgi:hypothetical protein
LPGARRTDETRALVAKVLKVGNFYESMGMLAKAGLVDRDLVFELWSANINQAWEKLQPYTAICRRSLGEALYENFEYITVLARSWLVAHPKGTFPASMPRIDVKGEWLEADALRVATIVLLIVAAYFVGRAT